MKIKPDWNPEATPTFWINHASRLIMRNFERELRPLGFGMAYLPVAVALAEDGPMQQKALLESVRIEQPTLVALLARMERDGVVTSKPDPADGRARLVSLTRKGKSQLETAIAAMHDIIDLAFVGVGERDRTALMKALRQVVENLSETSDEHDGRS